MMQCDDTTEGTDERNGKDSGKISKVYALFMHTETVRTLTAEPLYMERTRPKKTQNGIPLF